MGNERLRACMARAGHDVGSLASAVQVDPKTVQRWLAGRVPHPRHRWALAKVIGEEEGYLWPAARPDLAPGAEATPEIVAAYAHRADIPTTKWSGLVATSRRHLDILGYAFLFFPEQHIDLARIVEQHCTGGCRVRIALADPIGQHTAERDALENLNGTLPARIHMTLSHLRPLESLTGAEIRLHDVHLYNAIYRFDDEMIVTPYLYRAHGFQHPALHIRRLSAYGVFANFLDQFDDIWREASPLTERSDLTATSS
jgi:hypothetical protein